MDVEFMKSSAEDQIEMMLMQMGYSEDADETMHFNQQFNNTTNYNNNNNNSPTFTNHLNTSTISFSNNMSHDQQQQILHHYSSWRTDEYSSASASSSQKRSSMAAMREMIFRIAAMQPIHIDPESVKPPKRKNVKISSDPQSVAARHRRERISERIRILQRLVPGGTKMDTASMLDEAIHYVKFLKNQVQSLERVAVNRPVAAGAGMGFPVPMSSGSYYPAVGVKGYHHHSTSGHNNVQYLADA